MASRLVVVLFVLFGLLVCAIAAEEPQLDPKGTVFRQYQDAREREAKIFKRAADKLEALLPAADAIRAELAATQKRLEEIRSLRVILRGAKADAVSIGAMAISQVPPRLDILVQAADAYNRALAAERQLSLK